LDLKQKSILSLFFLDIEFLDCQLSYQTQQKKGDRYLSPFFYYFPLINYFFFF